MNAKALLRKTLLDIARRKQRPGAGTARTLLMGRTALSQWPDLTPVLGPLLWAVIGAAATRLYMPERATRDLDIMVRALDDPEVRKRLAAAGFLYQGELSIGGSSWLSPDGVPVDVVECGEPWFAQAVQEAQANRDAQGLPVLPLPYLALMKFQAGRLQDLADVARMLGQADEAALLAVRGLFARWLPEGSEDLKSLIALGRLELQSDESVDQDTGP